MSPVLSPLRKASRRTSFNPAMVRGLGGRITSKVNNLTQETIQEITRPKDKYTIKQYKELLETEPLSKACVELKRLRMMASMEGYENEDKKLQDFVLDNFATMDGNLRTAIGQLSSALPFGFAVAEIEFASDLPGNRGQWRLKSINPLDPERVSFAGRKGAITYVVYNDSGKKKYIEYSRCIHVVNGITFGDPYGSAECRRAMPYYKAKTLLFAEMMVAGKNNASAMLIAQADSNDTVQILGPDGNPLRNPDGSQKVMSAQEALMRQLEQAESNGIIATDLKNRVSPLLIPSGENFWNLALMLLKKEILLSFLVPSLIWDEGSGGLGNTGISGNHKSTLDANIGAIEEQIQEEVLEKIVRNLIFWNFGFHKKYGSFASQPYTDPNMIMSRASNLLTALSTGVIPQSDIDAVNRLREDLGVPPLDREQMMNLLALNVQQQQMQQGGMPAEQPYP